MARHRLCILVFFLFFFSIVFRLHGPAVRYDTLYAKHVSPVFPAVEADE